MTSYLRDAKNAWLVGKSRGDQLPPLSERLGLVKPSYLSDRAWSRALQAAMSPRGKPVSVEAFVEAALSDYATVLHVTIDPSLPHGITSDSDAFVQSLVGRFVRIEGRLYRVEGPAYMASHYAPGRLLELSTLRTPEWIAADWSGEPAPRVVRAEFLPFIVAENQASTDGGPHHGDATGTVTVYVFPEVTAGLVPSFRKRLPDSFPPTVDADGYYDPQPLDPWPSMVPIGNWLSGDPPLADVTARHAFMMGASLLGELARTMENMMDAGFKIRFVPFPAQVPILPPP